MAWIQKTKKKDGTTMYWVRDYRGGQAVVIIGGSTRAEAERRLEEYQIRRDLEKEGYDDQYQAMADNLWGTKRRIPRKAGKN